MVFDPSFIDDEEIERRWATLSRPGYREHFARMFTQDRQFYVDACALSKEELARIACPVLLMHGLNDKSFGPEQTSLPLARGLKRCDVMTFGQCGHSVALEHAETFTSLVRLFCDRI
jgi:pimeloyl-ACP methyl ester carboxylesterase